MVPLASSMGTSIDMSIPLSPPCEWAATDIAQTRGDSKMDLSMSRGRISVLLATVVDGGDGQLIPGRTEIATLACDRGK